ncbi:MAG: AraC family transcriptional regulator [Spirochaetaceae bacterium]|jgi:AraC-like DNA-binding protein|nr:AraC family transcriptional regulator [Spirochaetaceae bacterium]
MERDFFALPLKRQASRYPGRNFPLHVLTILSGHSRETEVNYYNDSRIAAGSPYGVWQYTLSGRGRIESREGSRDLLPGSLMILSVPGQQVYYLPEDSDHWEFVFLAMIGREAVRITRMIEQRLGAVTLTGENSPTVELLYTILGKLFAGDIADPFDNSSYTYRLCMTFLRETGKNRDIHRKQSFEELRFFLRGNLYRDIQVEEMADFMRMSRSHFTRIFSREMGMSPRSYLEDLRLKTAAEILFEAGTSIKETAARCGIYDVNYFCRRFKKHFGISPGKYKTQGL